MKSRLGHRWFTGFAVAGAITWQGAALADDSPGMSAASRFGGQRKVGLGPSAGFYNGLGGLLNLELEPVGLVVSGGYMPVLIFGNEGAERAFKFDYYSSAQVNADLLVGPLYRGRKVQIHLLAGYRYNTVLGHGGGLGLRFAIDVSRNLRLEFHSTPNVFPDATARLRERDYPARRDPAIPWLQGGLGAAAVLYP